MSVKAFTQSHLRMLINFFVDRNPASILFIFSRKEW